MFVSVQTIHKIFQTSFRNRLRNDNGNVFGTFYVILRKMFVQGCRNIGSKSSGPSYEYFEKLCLKHSARFAVIKELAWNISINGSPNLPKHFVKCLCPLSKPFTKYFRGFKYLQEACLKYFNKCCSKLARTFREKFVFSVQTIHKIFRKSLGGGGSKV